MMSFVGMLDASVERDCEYGVGGKMVKRWYDVLLDGPESGGR